MLIAQRTHVFNQQRTQLLLLFPQHLLILFLFLLLTCIVRAGALARTHGYCIGG